MEEVSVSMNWLFSLKEWSIDWGAALNCYDLSKQCYVHDSSVVRNNKTECPHLQRFQIEGPVYDDLEKHI